MMTLPFTLYLIGFAGSGKYTISKEISKYGYKVVDNHLINNPIFSLLDLNGETPIPEEAWEEIAKIRTAVVDFVSKDKTTNYVFTNELYDDESDSAIYNQVNGAAETRGSLFIPVKLNLSDTERTKRITNPERLTRFKTTNPGEAHLKKRMIHIEHPHLLEIDVTDLSAENAAKEIMNFVESVRR